MNFSRKRKAEAPRAFLCSFCASLPLRNQFCSRESLPLQSSCRSCILAPLVLPSLSCGRASLPVGPSCSLAVHLSLAVLPVSPSCSLAVVNPCHCNHRASRASLLPLSCRPCLAAVHPCQRSPSCFARWSTPPSKHLMRWTMTSSISATPAAPCSLVRPIAPCAFPASLTSLAPLMRPSQSLHCWHSLHLESLAPCWSS